MRRGEGVPQVVPGMQKDPKRKVERKGDNWPLAGPEGETDARKTYDATQKQDSSPRGKGAKNYYYPVNYEKNSII